MRIPDRLTALVDEGIIQEVVRPLMSGKEAQVYLVLSGGVQRVAKIYKEAQNRTFKQRAEYTEGRKVRNSRDQRAMGKGSRHGRAQDEEAWRSAEVDMLYRLQAAGVRVPAPQYFIEGVLIMELITDEDGHPAPRLAELPLDRDRAIRIFDQLLAEVVRMLSVGVVHGDLSEYNVLMGADGPVVIDFPQSVSAAGNLNARKLLLRDVDNLQRFLAKFAPDRRPLPYAQELWQLYESGELTPDVRLTGRYRAVDRQANTDAVLALIDDARRDEQRRRQGLGLRMPGTPARPPAPALRTPSGPGGGSTKPAPPRPEAPRGNKPSESSRGSAGSAGRPQTTNGQEGAANPKPRRHRRRRRKAAPTSPTPGSRPPSEQPWASLECSRSFMRQHPLRDKL